MTLKLHTNDFDYVSEILKENNISFKLQKKRVIKNHYETHNWYDLPSFEYDEDLINRKVIQVKKDLKEIIEEIFKKDIQRKGRGYYHIKLKTSKYSKYEYKITHKIDPKYPVYVLSKGRYEKRYTTDSLEEMDCPYKVVVEPQEYDLYNKYIDSSKILVLPKEYLNKNQGGIPARNFIWQHAIDSGFDKHWIIDDNIDGFSRWNYNQQKKVKSGVVFKIVEDYQDRYTNIGLSGIQYNYAVPNIDTGRKMIIDNSRGYSCMLLNHKLLDKYLEERWRGRYNEDTDLTLRILTSNKMATFLHNNVLCHKKTSGTMKGGNTDTIYDGGSHKGYQDKFNELYKNWPQYVKPTTKKHVDGRPHHHINYGKISNVKPIFKEGVVLDKICNDYNMVYEEV